MNDPIDPRTGRVRLGGRARRWPAGCDHAWEPVGVIDVYPVEGCWRCNSVAISPAPGHPPPFDVIIAALERAGCDPQPIEDDEDDR